jgi:uncharacterized protein YdaU (DUF1376 family)
MPTGMADYYMLASHLTPKQLGVWFSIRCHLWQHGSLPKAAADLAAVGRVHPQTWKRIEPVLFDLFDHDEDGGWRDFDLEAARAAALKKRGRLAEVGRGGALQRWATEAAEADPASQNRMAYAMANAIEEQGQSAPSAMAETGLPVGQAFASPGPTDGLDFLENKENLERSVGRSDARADGLAIGLASAEQPVDARVNGNHALADAIASGIPSATASGMANAMAKACVLPSDEEIIGAIRKVSSGKIAASMLTPSGIAPIRTLIESGCDWKRDVLPAIQSTVPGLKEPLRSLGAKFIREGAIANRDLASEEARVAATHTGRHFAALDSPEWRAWIDHGRTQGRKSYPQMEYQRQKGWFFDSQWPPGADPEQYAGRPAAPS